MSSAPLDNGSVFLAVAVACVLIGAAVGAAVTFVACSLRRRERRP